MNLNLVELNEMTDLLYRFFHESSHRMLMIGGIVGTHLLSHVLDAATEVYPFERVLTLEGCADYCYIPKRFVPNYIPYSYIFYDMYVPTLHEEEIFPVKFYQENFPTVKMIHHSMYQQYPIVIVNNAHLIDIEIIQQLVETCRWKIVLIGDPFDIGGEEFMQVPCLTTCLEKQSPIIGMARKLWDISTYAIDKRAPGNVTNGKVTRKGIGKMDGRMYITNDLEIVQNAQQQQRMQTFRKGLRFLVTDDRLSVAFDETKQQHVVTKNMMLIMNRANLNSPIPQQFRLYHSKQIIRLDIEYDHVQHYLNERDYHIRVKPANVLTPSDAKYHRYLNTVLVVTKEVPKREMYSIMKNSVNLAICTVKGSG